MEIGASDSLATEAKDALHTGGSVQVLIAGNPLWLEIVEVSKHGSLRKLRLADLSYVLIPNDALLAVRFGRVEGDEN